MRKIHRLIFTIVVLSVFLCINASSALAEDNSPEKIVENFAKAYFMLDNSMAQYLNKDALFNDESVNTVDLYLEKKTIEAHNLGYKITFLQKFPTKMEIVILSKVEERECFSIHSF
jgi:hypothetical protein